MEMQKITVEVPKDVLERAKAYVNGGTTAAVREGLEKLVRRHDQASLMELRGLYKPSITAEELRGWEDDEE